MLTGDKEMITDLKSLVEKLMVNNEVCATSVLISVDAPESYMNTHLKQGALVHESKVALTKHVNEEILKLGNQKRWVSCFFNSSE